MVHLPLDAIVRAHELEALVLEAHGHNWFLPGEFREATGVYWGAGSTRSALGTLRSRGTIASRPLSRHDMRRVDATQFEYRLT